MTQWTPEEKKDKKLSDKYKVSWDNVKEAYPDIQWGGRS